MRIAALPIRTILTLILVLSTFAYGQGPADELLKLVSPDAGVTITLEDLRGHAREIRDSGVAARLRKLPLFQEWLRSDNVRGVQVAAARVEGVLGQSLTSIADELLGHAAVLSLRVAPGEGLDSARGILLSKVPNRKLLDKLVDGLNVAMKNGGELVDLRQREHNGTKYSVREFQPQTRLTEYYAFLDGLVFAWSNSEDLLKGAIDRQAGTMPGLDGLAGYRTVREHLPKSSALSVFVDPRFVERLLASAPPSSKSDDERMFRLITRYVAALNYAGAAVTWNDGLLLHLEESFDPAKVDPGLKRWANRVRTPGGSTLSSIPKTALAVFSGSVDFEVALQLFESFSTSANEAKLENFTLVLKGLLLGRELRTDLLPKLGPEMLVYLERPDADGAPIRVPGTLILALGDGHADAAVENALRTILAFYALDDKHEEGKLRVQSRKVGDGVIITLGDSTPFAFIVNKHRLVIATSTEGVTRALAAETQQTARGHFEELRAAYFPRIETFVCVDLRALHQFADSHRPGLARRLAARENTPEAQAARDLDQGLTLISLFDAAFFTTEVEANFKSVHHTLGIVARPGVDKTP